MALTPDGRIESGHVSAKRIAMKWQEIGCPLPKHFCGNLGRMTAVKC